MDMPSMDHRGPEFGAIGFEVLQASSVCSGPKQPVHHLSVVRHRRVGGRDRQYAGQPGNKVLMAETGQFRSACGTAFAEKFM